MIAEPATTLTDWALAALSATLAAKVSAQASPPAAARLWAAGFGAVALAALLGGTSHGFAPNLPAGAVRWLWFGTYASIGLANLCLLCAALAPLASAPRRGFAVAVVVKFAGYLVLAVARRDFDWVIVDMALTLAGLLALGAQGWRAARPGSGWLLAAVGVSFTGALVQHGRLGLHRHFNHNDVFHVVQMVAMILFHRAARLWRSQPEAGR